MADFCWQCLERELAPECPECNDLAGLCVEGETANVLCEGCGVITVDHQGKNINPAKLAAPNDKWCVGCSPDNCCGCP